MANQEQVRQILEEIASHSSGILHPEAVVMVAAAPDHPLHDRFEWDDTKAGHSHRVDQARTLIRSVRVETITSTRTIETVYYVRDPNAIPGESGYVSLPRLRTDAEKTAAALVQEFSRAVAILKRARDLAAALGVEHSVDELLLQLQRISAAVPEIRAS